MYLICSILRNFLMQWGNMQHKNEAHKLMNQALPIVICWNLWKNRCAVKYGAKQSNMRIVKFLIWKNILQIFNTVFPYIQWSHNWNDLIFMVENCSHEIKVIPVLWERPCNGVYKLNTDRSALNNPDKIGGGGILRDHQGKLVYVFVVPLGIGTNYQA